MSRKAKVIKKVLGQNGNSGVKSEDKAGNVEGLGRSDGKASSGKVDSDVEVNAPTSESNRPGLYE